MALTNIIIGDTPMTKGNPSRQNPKKKTITGTGGIHSKSPSEPKRSVAKPSQTKSRAANNDDHEQQTEPPPRLLSGGNPQITKGYGEDSIRAYIAAMPGWKRRMGERIDAMIASSVPRGFALQKAVKWNSPLYGHRAPNGDYEWFLSVHCFEKYIKVAFFRGASLTPLPPEASKQKDVRYLHIREDWGNHPNDETQFAAWVRQASQLQGERM